jgi:hypothetical protein
VQTKIDNRQKRRLLSLRQLFANNNTPGLVFFPSPTSVQNVIPSSVTFPISAQQKALTLGEIMRSISQIILLLAFFSCNTKTEKDISDNKELKQNSSIQITWDTAKYLLNYCSAKKIDTVLQLTIGNLPDTIFSPYELKISKGIHGSDIEVYQTYAASDCLYVTSYFKTIIQKLSFDKTSYKKGAELEGTIDLLLLGHKPYHREPGEMKRRENFDTVRINGRFTSIVE